MLRLLWRCVVLCQRIARRPATLAALPRGPRLSTEETESTRRCASAASDAARIRVNAGTVDRSALGRPSTESRERVFARSGVGSSVRVLVQIPASGVREGPARVRGWTGDVRRHRASRWRSALPALVAYARLRMRGGPRDRAVLHGAAHSRRSRSSCSRCCIRCSSSRRQCRSATSSASSSTIRAACASRTSNGATRADAVRHLLGGRDSSLYRGARAEVRRSAISLFRERRARRAARRSLVRRRAHAARARARGGAAGAHRRSALGSRARFRRRRQLARLAHRRRDVAWRASRAGVHGWRGARALHEGHRSQPGRGAAQRARGSVARGGRHGRAARLHRRQGAAHRRGRRAHREHAVGHALGRRRGGADSRPCADDRSRRARADVPHSGAARRDGRAEQLAAGDRERERPRARRFSTSKASRGRR